MHWAVRILVFFVSVIILSQSDFIFINLFLQDQQYGVIGVTSGQPTETSLRLQDCNTPLSITHCTSWIPEPVSTLTQLKTCGDVLKTSSKECTAHQTRTFHRIWRNFCGTVVMVTASSASKTPCSWCAGVIHWHSDLCILHSIKSHITSYKSDSGTN